MAKAKKKSPLEQYRDKVLAAIPSNWCDELLSGKGTQIPLDCPAVEKLLNGVRARIAAIDSRRDLK